MRAHAKCLASAAVLLLSASVVAQQPEPAANPDLLARFSYDSSANVQSAETETRSVCLSVSRDGAYRIVRSMSDGQTQRLAGKMPQKDLQQLKALLEGSDFRAPAADHSGLIFQKSESFAAEIPLQHADLEVPLESYEPPIQHLQWLSGDGGSRFPAPVSKLVDWMKHFEPKNAKEFEYAEYPDVCPSGGLRLVQPAIAENGQR